MTLIYHFSFTCRFVTRCPHTKTFGHSLCSNVIPRNIILHAVMHSTIMILTSHEILYPVCVQYPQVLYMIIKVGI